MVVVKAFVSVYWPLSWRQILVLYFFELVTPLRGRFKHTISNEDESCEEGEADEEEHVPHEET